MKHAPTAGLVLALALGVSACGGGGDSQASGDGGDELTVLAAASLTEVFGQLEQDYTDDNGGSVQESFGSSTDLAESAADGAPGDVLATADEESMQIAVDAGVTAAEPVRFATNELAIVTAPGNPDDIQGLADLGGTTWVRCADDVPCGKVALTLLDGVDGAGESASLEVDVKSTLDKVTSGEADAGLVYASDAVAAGEDVTMVPIDGADRALTTYWIAPLEGSGEAARQWVDLVTSEVGRQALTDAGFTLP
ncbi:molybdate ABC transporter substrate-binding protein [Nocardioides rotundus]|uniref:molybdate ABC transporter substrate-binding protein n=1 Tax=Nocardioides rotundus TaxID=1774216 RepID=UPI001CBCF23A|nr:molybdate ABC transporter substrate-binding protein [Nocardioides rotundus]UAL30678.1 molybdate ABC transporter substrate-binding protein [Nocardioides rotundus]